MLKKHENFLKEIIIIIILCDTDNKIIILLYRSQGYEQITFEATVKVLTINSDEIIKIWYRKSVDPRAQDNTSVMSLYAWTMTLEMIWHLSNKSYCNWVQVSLQCLIEH